MIKVEPASLNGSVAAPPSKSFAIRYLILAALMEGKSRIKGLVYSQDVDDAIALLRSAGITPQGKNNVEVSSTGRFSFSEVSINGSATVLRIAIALASSFPGRKIIRMGENLSKRPLDQLVSSLSRNGVTIGRSNNILFIDGQVKNTDFEIEANVSSQYITALLFLSAAMQREVSVKLRTPQVSRTYVEITAKTLEACGIRVAREEDTIYAYPGNIHPMDVTIPGDFALSSFLGVIAARNGHVIHIENLEKSSGGDSIIIDIFRDSGVHTRLYASRWEISGSESINAVDIDLSDYPDLLPPIAALLSESNGTSTISGVGHLRYKESDRIAETAKLLSCYGIGSRIQDNTFFIYGSKGHRFHYDSPDDHRMAMAAVALASRSGGTISGEGCIRKSYPSFLTDFKFLGGKVDAS
ncbi:MAG: hypothetical protein QW812_05205 [Thermoplasmataceae archaeon]